MVNNKKEIIVKSKKIMHFRPLFCIFLCIILGISASVSKYLGINIVFITSLIIEGVLIVCFILSFVNVNCIFFSVIKRFRVVFLIVLISVVASFGITNLFISIYSYREVLDGDYYISARIKDVSEKQENYILTLENVFISDKNCDFNVKVIINQNITEISNFMIGGRVELDVSLTSTELWQKNGLNSSVINNKIYYYGYVNSVLSYREGDITIFEGFKNNVKNELDENLSKYNSKISYALLFGDKSEVDEEIYNVFKDCGLAHVLAISGLHIGLLVALLIFVMKKFKLKSFTRFIILTIILYTYCLICGFTASVVRATIMSLVYALAECFGERKDILSTISLAGIIILIVNPLQLYTLGFLLSFASVFGIIFLLNPISLLLQKIMLPKYISDMLAVTLSATIATFTILSISFKTIALSTLISNLILLPIFTLLYYFLFISTFINLMLPLTFLFKIVEFLFNILLSIGTIFASFGVIEINSFSAFAIIISFVLIMLFSNFINLNRKIKAIISLFMITLICVSLIFTNSNMQYTSNNVFVVNETENTYIVTTENNYKYLIGAGNGDEKDFGNIKDALMDKRIFKLNGIVVLNYDGVKQDALINIIEKFKPDNIYLNLNDTEKFISTKIIEKATFIDFSSNIKLDNLSVRGLSYNDKFFATSISLRNKEIVLLDGILTNARANYINTAVNNSIVFLEKDYVGINNLLGNHTVFIKSGTTRENVIKINKYLYGVKL